MNERRGRARRRSLVAGASAASACIIVVCASTSALAQHAPAREGPSTTATATVESESPSRATRVALGATAALGVSVLSLGVPFEVGVALSSAGPGLLITSMSIGSALTLGLAPLGYVLAGDATGGRGRYWAALVGWCGGLALGALPLPIFFASSPFANTTGLIVGVSVLMPLLGVTGMAIGYELSHNAQPTEAAPRVARARSRSSWWAPSIAIHDRAMLLSIGGAL